MPTLRLRLFVFVAACLALTVALAARAEAIPARVAAPPLARPPLADFLE